MFAIGVAVANSAPGRSFPSLLVVLYVAWAGQVVGNVLLAFAERLRGRAGHDPRRHLGVPRCPTPSRPTRRSCPGFWLLVPGALGLIGLTQVAGDAGSAGVQELGNTVASIFAVAVGVLCGTLLLGWAKATGRAIGRALRRRCGPLAVVPAPPTDPLPARRGG